MRAPIVKSLAETDLYKFTMLQTFLHKQPGAKSEYAFACRNSTAFPLAELKDEVDRELDHLCSLRFTEPELAYLGSLRFLKSDFIDYLRLFQFQRRFITTSIEGDQLKIAAKGPLIHVMGFEIFALYIVNELYFRRLSEGNLDAVMAEGRARLQTKIALLKQEQSSLTESTPFEFFDFGLRRRFSGEWHDEVVETLARELPDLFKGTSNVYLAMKHKLTPIGTMAHEYLQAYQAFDSRLRNFQKYALEGWVQEYRGDLGIALTDVVGMDAFLADFDLYFAKLFDGLRHDSGDPVEWGEKAIKHYQKLRIDARSKRLVFSDGLSVPKAISLYRHFGSRISTGFGIGTNLTNDLGIPSLNIVMKIISCEDAPVAKLSDTPGKTMCKDEKFLGYLREVFGITAPTEK